MQNPFLGGQGGGGVLRADASALGDGGGRLVCALVREWRSR